MANTSYTTLITTTLQNHGKEIFDAVSSNNALYYMLKQRGNIKLVAGGRTFTHPIYWNQNTSFKSYAKLATIDTPLMDDITRAEYSVKVIAGSLVLSTLEEAMNAGNKEKLIDLARQTKEAAQISMTEVMGVQTWKNGEAANDFDGLQHLISTTPALGTVGGINRATYNYWRNNQTTIGGAFNTTDFGIIGMNTVMNNTTFGTQGPKAIFTTTAVYGLYELSMTSNIRYLKTELADKGFRHLAYATLPVVFDANCPAETMYFVDLNNLWLQLLSRGNFQVTPFENSTNQLSRIALMYVFGNLTMGSGRTQGVLTGITS